MKGKDRMQMEESCVYEVKDGKVVSEQFFSNSILKKLIHKTEGIER